jgi:hypothetical protein
MLGYFFYSMNNDQKKHQRFLVLIIILLIAFNAVQVTGILTDEREPVKQAAPAAKTENDSSMQRVQINVLNGCGISGVGNTITTFCRARGYDVVEMGNYKSFDVEFSMVIDRGGKIDQAHELAALLGISPKNVVTQFSSEHIVDASVIIGKDYGSLNPWEKK